MKRDGQNKSLWQKVEFDNLPESSTKDYDVIMAGAGITGVTAALNLQKAGKKCLIIEAANPGFGTTGGTTAHINNFYDAQYDIVKSKHGEEAAKLLAETGPEILAYIKKNISDYNIDCAFSECSSFVYSTDEKHTKNLEKMFEATREVGLDISWVGENPFPISAEKIAEIKGQGQFHPIQYIKALLLEFLKLGGQLITNTRIESAEEKDDLVEVNTELQKFSAKDFIWATHTPPGIHRMNAFTAPYRSYVLAFTLKDEKYPAAQAADMNDPYHYMRTQEIDGKKYIIFGGEDHRTGSEDDAEERFNCLEDYARQFFEIENIAFKWSSQYYTANDALPFIGVVPGEKHIYWATGYDGNGMSFGTLSGIMIPDLILGKENKYEKLFSPSRISPVAGFTEFVKESAANTYELVKGKFSAEKLESLTEVKNDEGKIVKIDGDTLAVYRDADGKIHALSSVCRHMGCTVVFNTSEKSWDCPCHGARYDIDGKVINGPALHSLEKIN